MNRVLWRTSVRYLRNHPAQLLLCVLGISLGVAVPLATSMALESARRSLELSRASLVPSTHRVTADSQGLDEKVYAALRGQRGGESAVPVVESPLRVIAPQGGVVDVIGIDPYRLRGSQSLAEEGSEELWHPSFTQLMLERNSVVLETSAALFWGVAVGDSVEVEVEGESRRLQVIATFDAPREALRARLLSTWLTDISTAQELFGWQGRLSRVELNPSDDEAKALERWLAQAYPNTVLEANGATVAQLQQLTQSFELNLECLSLLSLVVGMFLILNAMTFSVVQRQQFFGRLRSLGVTRAEVLRLILGEAFLLSLLGSALGLGLGWVLGRGLVHIVTDTINDLYFRLQVVELDWNLHTWLVPLLLGCVAPLLAALKPAWDASRADVGEVVRRSIQETRGRRASWRWGIGSLLLAAAAWGLLQLPTTVSALVGPLRVSYAVLFLVLCAFAALTPLFARVSMALAARLPLGLLWRVAARSILTQLSRIGIAVAALAVAVGMAVGVELMIRSFRGAVVTWLESSLTADIYVAKPGWVARQGSDDPLDRELVAQLLGDTSVADAILMRRLTVPSEKGRVRLAALGFAESGVAAGNVGTEAFSEGSAESKGKAAGFELLEQGANPWQRFFEGEAIFISEPFAYRHQLGVGDSLSMKTRRGDRAFAIAGIFFDLASDEGFVLLGRRALKQHFDDESVTGLALLLAKGRDPVVEAARMQRLAGDAFVRANRSLREATLEIFDRTFRVTTVLRLLAMVVAAIGVFSAFLAIALERTREYAVFRARGLSTKQLTTLIPLQGALIGSIAGCVAVPLGIVVSHLLIRVVQRQSFGWSIPLDLKSWAPLEGIGIAVVAAALAAVIPALRMAKIPLSEALREE